MDKDKEIEERIALKVREGLDALGSQRRSWVRDHLIPPRPIRLSTDPDGSSFETLWLVTDHVGNNDSPYRVAYDETEHAFGLEVTLDTGVEWYTGAYGTFFETVEKNVTSYETDGRDFRRKA